MRQTGPTTSGRQASDDVADVFILVAGLRGSGQSKAHLETIGACLSSAHIDLPELDASFGVGVGASLSVDCDAEQGHEPKKWKHDGNVCVGYRPSSQYSHRSERTRRPLLYLLCDGITHRVIANGRRVLPGLDWLSPSS